MTNQPPRLSTGVAGLDEILAGGLLPGYAYLVRGGPGSGKTTLGLHFLAAGRAAGERALFITLEESEERIRKNAATLGLDLSGVEFVDLSPPPEFFVEVQTYDIFAPAEVEREPLTRRIVERVTTLKPQRVFVDPLTQFRYLASDVYQFRRQVLSFLRFLTEHGATVMFTSEAGAETPDDDLQFMSDGVIHLDNTPQGRTLSVSKFRGSAYQSGCHSLRLTEHGMEVFPRLVPEVRRKEIGAGVIPSGIAELDQMLGGGLERGTVTIISGPSGVGKTTLGLQFMKEAATRGEHSVVYSFEEETEIITRRCESLGIPVCAMVEKGTLALVKVEPLQYTPDEFARLVRLDVEERQRRIVMLDSAAGYRLSLRGEDLVSHLHALCKYLQNQGAVVLLIAETAQVTGDFQITESGISYLADNIIFLRYLEMEGEMHKAIGVLKKRLSDFEKALREFSITSQGIQVGPPLTALRGILTGEPEWVSKSEDP